MGMDLAARDAWRFGREELAAKLDSPHADKVFLAKDYTKADLRRELLATMADASREHIARYPKIRARLAGG